MTLRTAEQKNRLEIQVRDNGMGIQKEHLPHIFDRFYRIEGGNRQIPGVSGSGLGLALTRELVKLLNGTVKVESIYGEGTVFIVSLPVTNNAPLTGEAELFKMEKSIP